MRLVDLIAGARERVPNLVHCQGGAFWDVLRLRRGGNRPQANGESQTGDERTSRAMHRHCRVPLVRRDLARPSTESSDGARTTGGTAHENKTFGLSRGLESADPHAAGAPEPATTVCFT